MFSLFIAHAERLREETAPGIDHPVRWTKEKDLEYEYWNMTWNMNTGI